MGLHQRLAKLEQRQEGGGGAGICGVRRVHHLTGNGPDVVDIPQTGERLTEAAFFGRYPRGILILSIWYGWREPTGDEVA